MSVSSRIVASAIYGSFAWAVYGVVEYCFVVFSRLYDSSEYSLPDWHWPFTGLLFAGYVLAGFIGGGLAGLAFECVRRIGTPSSTLWHRSAGVLPVILVFAGNLLLHSGTRTSLLYASVCVLPLWAVFAQLYSRRWRFLAESLTNPWAVGLLLIAPFWVARAWLGDASRSVKLAALIVTLIGLNGIFVLWRRFVPRIGPGVAFAGVVIIAVLMSVTFNRELPVPVNAAPPSNTTSRLKPNIILIVMDTVRADHLSLYGYSRDTTPNLKHFSRAATLYTHAIATSDMSLGTHGSMFTGLYPSWHGAHYAPPDFPLGRPLDDKFETLAEFLSGEGYWTLGISANTAYLGPQYLLHQGFKYFDARLPVPMAPLADGFYLRRLTYKLPNTLGVLCASRRRADEISRKAIRRIADTRATPAPFFLFLNYMDAHMPYLPTRLFSGRKELYTTLYIDRLRFDMFQKDRRITTTEQDHIRSQYDGQITYLDGELGKLFKSLKDSGLWDDTLIIVTSDHGDALGERNLLDHAVSVYQDQIHVPLIVKYPGQRAGRTVTVPASHVDIFPTIIEQLGKPIPPQLHGSTLADLDRSPNRAVFAESFPCLRYGKVKVLNRWQRAVVQDGFKFIESTSGQKELYSLFSDPNEQHNLYGYPGTPAKDLEATLLAWIESAPVHKQSRPSVSKDNLERLRSLGYVQ